MENEPNKCKQCAIGDCLDSWTVCPNCFRKNMEYEACLDKYRRDIRFHTPYHRMKDTGLMSKENKGRKSRSKDEYAKDDVQEHSERNARTDYHGYNYTDE